MTKLIPAALLALLITACAPSQPTPVCTTTATGAIDACLIPPVTVVP